MIHPSWIRLYQCLVLWVDDTKKLTDKNFTSGYSYKRDQTGENPTPGITRGWHEFPVPGTTGLDARGNMKMCVTGEQGNRKDVAWNECDPIRLGHKLHQDVQVSHITRKEWWNDIIRSVSGLSAKLHKAGVPQKDILRIIVLCCLYTSSDQQLGQVCHLVDVWNNEDEGLAEAFNPPELRDQFMSDAPHLFKAT